MKIKKVSFRDAVGANASTGFNVPEDGAAELHPAGALLSPKKGDRLLVPFSNIKALHMADEEKK